MGARSDRIIRNFANIVNSGEKKTKAYDTTAVVTKVEGGTAWVHIPGGIDETPVSMTMNASAGDTVQVRVSGGRAFLIGNASSPPTDDKLANEARKTAQIADSKAVEAFSAAATAQTAASYAQRAADEAQSSANSAAQAAEEAWDKAESAETAANNAQTSADNAATAAGNAAIAAANAQEKADEAYDSALTANTAANGAVTSLGIVQGVVDSLSADVDDLQTHVAMMDAVVDPETGETIVPSGLHVVPTSNGYFLVVSNDGVYVYDPRSVLVATFGENIDFSSDRPQRIGGDDVYIEYYDSNNDGKADSLRIVGASFTFANGETIEQKIQESTTLVYDHTYEIVGTDAIFTAFLYQGTEDVKNQYEPSLFTWYLKTEDGTTYLGDGYTMTVSLLDCGYGAEILGKFTTPDNAQALTRDGDNLTIDDEPTTVRASGDSVRISDLSISTSIYPQEKLMVVGAENEHLISFQTLQDYLNANITKQVRFDTTAGWSSQISLVSDPNTLYIYTDYKTDAHGNSIAGIKAGDGNAFVVDLPFIDAIADEHISDNTVHVTNAERTFWNNKVRCYYAGTEQLVFTIS